MSIRVMNMVFERYPVGGNEGMLALALADHAHDDGSRIWPSLDLLARKTKQSRSSVRRHLKAMVDSGWLQQVKQSDGRCGGTNEYCIHPEWIAGRMVLGEGVNLNPSPEAEAPVDKPVDGHEGEGVNLEGEGVTAMDREGVTAVVPESSGTVREPSIPPLPPVETGGCVQQAGESPKPKGPKDRAPWRWADKRSGIEERAEALGIGPWDERAWTRGEGPDFRTFKARVFASHLAQLGVTTSPQLVAKAMADDKANNHSALLRRLAGHNEETP